MDRFAGALLFGCILIFIAPLLGVLFGAFSGWAVGLMFEDTILDFLSRVGVTTSGLRVWQVGAAMGFLGGFLKTGQYQRSE